MHGLFRNPLERSLEPLQPRRQASSLRKFRFPPALVACIVLLATRAQAASRDCTTSSSPIACRLDSLLNVLYVLAIVLGIGLVVVIIAAVRYFRKNRSNPRELP